LLYYNRLAFNNDHLSYLPMISFYTWILKISRNNSISNDFI
jgi:hypothetical protein